MENKKKITISQSAASVITAFVGVVILMVVFSFMNPNFIKPDSIMALLRSIVPYLLVGIGQAYVCITGNIDLSIGSVLGMSAMISATMMCKGFNPLVAILVAFVCWMAVGFVNGVLVGKFKLPPFIATLGTMTIARGVAQLANNNYNTDNIRPLRTCCTMEKPWGCSTACGSPSSSGPYSSTSCPTPAPAGTSTPSAPMWTPPGCPV